MGARAQHNYAYRRLCGLLRQWRTDADLTQRALASRLGKPHSYVHKSEIGDRRIDPLEFIAWCRACGLKPRTAIAEVERRAASLR
jgi:transcriptional regulator with XRE-family HTH domain